ncbi:hypothetical protein [Roseateles sp. L2-2]|uniref:hypothetical protein n=1 Tax=Roseateles sp. L2-2 TaxID=3422597 RepID=UPI003D360DE7
MTTSATTRKPVDQLSAVDLETFPIWEFVSDDGGNEDEDETWVKPVLAQNIPTIGYALCIAAAARLASGAIYPAVLFGDAVDGLAVSGLALLTTEGRVLFHASDSATETRRALKRLGMVRHDVFPIEFSTRATSAATGAHVFGRWE